MANSAVAAALLERAEQQRARTSVAVGATGTRSQHGQFFTPATAARLIASMPAIRGAKIRLLDPGAGSGILTTAFVCRWLTEAPDVRLEIVAVERDPSLVQGLVDTLADCEKVAADLGASLTTTAIEGDFIDLSTGLDQWSDLTAGFDLVIQTRIRE